jgi:hypothetical protein
LPKKRLRHAGAPLKAGLRLGATELQGARFSITWMNPGYVERQNLNMRMGMRRFTRLTNAFSKKVENHGHAIALFYMYYNFARIHQTLKTETPAMAAGVSDHVWSIEEVAELIP